MADKQQWSKVVYEVRFPRFWGVLCRDARGKTGCPAPPRPTKSRPCPAPSRPAKLTKSAGRSGAKLTEDSIERDRNMFQKYCTIK